MSTPNRWGGLLAVIVSMLLLTLCGVAAAKVQTEGSGAGSGQLYGSRTMSVAGATGDTSSTGATGATSFSSMLLPPAGDVFTGISGDDATAYESETGKHPAVFGSFITWGHPFGWAFGDAAGTHARVMLHISTTLGDDGASAITPRGIAEGHGDGYLLSLAREIAQHDQPVYIRLLPEMNNAHNAYSADDMDGSSRGPAYSHEMFKQAWRRTVIILRGGPVSAIDAKLASLKLPALRGIPSSGTLPVSPIAFIWCPETAGTPNVRSESAASYWPGSAYVDWVGTDFYSAFPNFRGLRTFYEAHPRKPFVFAEWAMWENDSTAFVDEFFSFINTHPRVKMILYNQGYGSASPLLLSKYPAAASAIRRHVAAPRYVGYAPEWQPRTLGATGTSGTSGASGTQSS